jgi:predicted negative regulator of RcsB-dependent stress response
MKASIVTNRNLVFLIAGALIAVVAVLGYRVYEDNREPKGMQLNVGPGGISLEKK